MTARARWHAQGYVPAQVPVQVPEPATAALLALGLVGLAAARRRATLR